MADTSERRADRLTRNAAERKTRNAPVLERIDAERRLLEAADVLPTEPIDTLGPTASTLSHSDYEASEEHRRLLEQRLELLSVLQSWEVAAGQLQAGAISEPPRRLLLRSRALRLYLSGERDTPDPLA